MLSQSPIDNNDPRTLRTHLTLEDGQSFNPNRVMITEVSEKERHLMRALQITRKLFLMISWKYYLDIYQLINIFQKMS